MSHKKEITGKSGTMLLPESMNKDKKRDFYWVIYESITAKANPL